MNICWKWPIAFEFFVYTQDLEKRCDQVKNCADNSDEFGCKVLTDVEVIMRGYIKVFIDVNKLSKIIVCFSTNLHNLLTF